MKQLCLTEYIIQETDVQVKKKLQIIVKTEIYDKQIEKYHYSLIVHIKYYITETSNLVSKKYITETLQF